MAKHNWILDENGKPDEWVWESGFHNGVVCMDCGFSLCVHCNEDWLEMDDCPGPRVRKPQTNADRIRAWNDHELAETIANFVSDIDNGNARYSDDPNDWLEWLQQPAEEE